MSPKDQTAGPANATTSTPRFDAFHAYRSKMNCRILGDDDKRGTNPDGTPRTPASLNTKRFFRLDGAAYEQGALTTQTKELLGLVASMVLRCDDCIAYHIDRCVRLGTTDGSCSNRSTSRWSSAVDRHPAHAKGCRVPRRMPNRTITGQTHRRRRRLPVLTKVSSPTQTVSTQPVSTQPRNRIGPLVPSPSCVTSIDDVPGEINHRRHTRFGIVSTISVTDPVLARTGPTPARSPGPSRAPTRARCSPEFIRSTNCAYTGCGVRFRRSTP